MTVTAVYDVNDAHLEMCQFQDRHMSYPKRASNFDPTNPPVVWHWNSKSWTSHQRDSFVSSTSEGL